MPAQQDWSAALRQIELAAGIAVEQDRRAGFVDLLCLAGGLCRDLGQPAVALCGDAADPSMAGDAWRVLAAVHEKRGESENARLAYAEALAAYERAGAAAQAQEVRQALAGIPG